MNVFIDFPTVLIPEIPLEQIDALAASNSGQELPFYAGLPMADQTGRLMLELEKRYPGDCIRILLPYRQSALPVENNGVVFGGPHWLYRNLRPYAEKFRFVAGKIELTPQGHILLSGDENLCKEFSAADGCGALWPRKDNALAGALKAFKRMDKVGYVLHYIDLWASGQRIN
jgi:hypothetical protein